MRTDLASLSAPAVVLSEHWARTFHEYFKNLRVIGNPINPSTQFIAGQRDENHVLLLGRNDSVKGHEFAKLAIESLRKKRPNLRLSMTGVSDSSEPWASGLGWISEEEKAVLLQTSSVLLVPSLFEGQPLVVFEALASGLPVLASDSIHSVPDSVVHARYHDLEDWVEKLDAILEVSIDSAALLESVKEHHISHVQKHWQTLYEELLL
tara:strand:- start:690 stop:1313 length:624 start_codon:yes stop_codon:yes gene_type:complete